MKIVRGDLLALAAKGEFDVIVHGCNCMCTMGAGIARSIRDKYPESNEADRQTTKGDRSKLGTFTSATVRGDAGTFVIVNAYTQFDYRGAGVKADYEAIRRVFRKVKNEYGGKRIGYPKIGAGLAGGDWNMIARIIDVELAGEDHTYVEYAP